jgi:uncharacterized protein YraI
MPTRFMTCALFLFAAASTCAAAPPSVRLRRDLKARAAPVINAGRVARLSVGEHYAALDRRSGWIQVQAGERRPWVSAADTSASTLAARVVVADRLNVRAKPSGVRLGALVEGTWIVVRERRGAWVRFDFAGREGWVHGDYLLAADASFAQLSATFLRRARRERSRPSHLAYLDRGLASSRWRAEAGLMADRLKSLKPVPNATPSVDPRYPQRGALPAAIASAVIERSAVAQLCRVRVRPDALGLAARWSGHSPFQTDQFWSATKHLQALGLIEALGRRDPNLRCGELRLRDAGGTSRRLADVLRAIVSYERGVWFSNAAAGTLGRLRTRSERQRALAALTGHASDFRGGYGARPFAARPELRDGQGRLVLAAPLQGGPPGPNLVSAYDLTRALATLSWHHSLAPNQRASGAQWHSLRPLVLALAHDPARYLDLALEQLGVAGRMREVVILSKLGHGIRSATGRAEIAYTALFQARDAWTGKRLAFCFSLRVEHSDPVVCDARTAAAVTALVRAELRVR